jgi:hypothetical protein
MRFDDLGIRRWFDRTDKPPYLAAAKVGGTKRFDAIEAAICGVGRHKFATPIMRNSAS